MPTQNINVGRNITPQIELFGDWDKALALFNNLPELISVGAHAGKLAAAKKIQTLVKKNIKKGGPTNTHWQELSASYQKSKASRGGDPNKKWFFQGTYYRSIKVIDKGNTVYVGVPARQRSRVNKNKPLTLGQVAVILERGSAARNIPARPLWKPTYREFGGNQRVTYHILWHVSNTVFLRTGYRPQMRY